MTSTEEVDAGKPEKLITIKVNKQDVVVRKHTTGAQIKEAADVPLDFTLYQRHGKQHIDIENDASVTVHENEKFIAVSGQDVS